MPKTITFDSLGGPEVFQIQELEQYPPTPGPNDVQIQVKAIGLNRADAMYRRGKFIHQPNFPHATVGSEASGIVVAIGANVSHVAIGDAVSVVPSFKYSEYSMYGEVVNAPGRAVVKNVAGQTFEQGSATWMMFMTAYGALIDAGRLEKGQYVVIRAASSSVGLAAIQIANYCGAHPIALTRNDSKRQKLLDAKAYAVVATQDEQGNDRDDIVSQINEITKGQGVAIVLDPVGGPMVATIMATMAYKGRYFQFGGLDPRDVVIPIYTLLLKHLVLATYQLYDVTLSDEKLPPAIDFIRQGLETGALTPVIDRVFDFAQIVQAHEYLESNHQFGKIVLQVGADQQQ